MLTEQTEEHSYIYAGSKLLREIITTTAEDGTETEQILDFRYDNAGLPYALHYTDTFEGIEQTYYYITNLQGDVMYIVDETGDEVASYDYDPYGKLIYSTGNMAEANPLRYRGYYYDNDTDFYYLQSRYYDPTICRFLNADSYANAGYGFLGSNMLTYCNNDPINAIDATGCIPNRAVMMSDGGSPMPDELRVQVELMQQANERGIVLHRSMDAAAEAWAAENRPLSKDRERVAYIYECYGYYYYGETYAGAKGFWFVPDNVIVPTLRLQMQVNWEGSYGVVVAQIHSHPNPEPGYHNDFPSADIGLWSGDQIAYEVFGYSEMYVIPFKYCEGTSPIVKFSDRATWCQH